MPVGIRQWMRRLRINRALRTMLKREGFITIPLWQVSGNPSALRKRGVVCAVRLSRERRRARLRRYFDLKETVSVFAQERDYRPIVTNVCGADGGLLVTYVGLKPEPEEQS